MFSELKKRPFRLVFERRIVGIFVEDKIIRFFIDTKISEMDKFLIDAFGCILFGGKTNKAILINVNPQRVEAGDQDINPQIILVPID